MPPKTKSRKAGKGKSSVVDALSTEEMSKDQLEEHIVRLREELDREREERSYFQLERDKIQAFWEICKRNVEETKAELRNRSRQREEAEERHRVEITVYKQKLKHVLSEHHNTISEVKTGGVASLSQVQKQQMEAELVHRGDVQDLQAYFREKKLQYESSIKELQLKHQVELLELTNDYDRRMREMEVKYDRRRQRMIEAEEAKGRVAVAELEEQMKSRVVCLMEDHDRALRRAEEYYSGLQSNLLTDQKLLKELLAETQKREERASKELSGAQQENERVSAALQEAEQKLPELHRQLEQHEQAKRRMETRRAHVKLMEKELRDVLVEHQLLLQAFDEVQRERDELLKKQTDAILEVQQRSGLKDMLLDRKLAALSDTLEKKEAQLCAALSASNIHPTAGGKLEEILESKQVTIGALQEDLGAECQEYDELLHTCRERLKGLGVLLHDFPFRAAERVLNRAAPTH